MASLLREREVRLIVHLASVQILILLHSHDELFVVFFYLQMRSLMTRKEIVLVSCFLPSNAVDKRFTKRIIKESHYWFFFFFGNGHCWFLLMLPRSFCISIQQWGPIKNDSFGLLYDDDFVCNVREQNKQCKQLLTTRKVPMGAS